MCQNLPFVNRFFNDATDLPTLPEVAQRLIATFGREDVSLRELAALIAQDTALTARLLRLANSVRYRPRERITRLQDAAALIGLGPLRSLAMGACLARAFPALPGFDRLRFWRQNLATAAYSRWLASTLGLDTDTAEVAGLVLRSGELLMMMTEPGTAVLVESLAGAPDSIFELQRLHFGCTHAELSAELAVRWRFPATIIDTLYTAADPLAAHPFSAEGGVLRAASVMADAADDGVDPLLALQEFQPALVLALGLDLDALGARLPDITMIASSAGEMLH
jgi:HD-like signal output (HDOD) protein